MYLRVVLDFGKIQDGPEAPGTGDKKQRQRSMKPHRRMIGQEENDKFRSRRRSSPIRGTGFF